MSHVSIPLWEVMIQSYEMEWWGSDTHTETGKGAREEMRTFQIRNTTMQCGVFLSGSLSDSRITVG